MLIMADRDQQHAPKLCKRGLERFVMFAAVWLCAGASGADARQISAATAQLRADINELRYVMGAPVTVPANWAIVNAGERHTHYTAQTLLAKVNRLTQELTAESRPNPPAAGPDGDAANIPVALAQAQAVLRDLMRQVGVEPAPAQAPPTNATYTNALVAMMETSRQLNAMLVHEYRPADIYDLIEQAIRHVGPATSGAYPALPPLTGIASPTDVYKKLLDCHELVLQVGAKRDLPVLRLASRRERRRSAVEVSDVYDFARLLLADIGGVLSRQPNGPESRASPSSSIPYRRPPYIYSTHVHRLANVLESLLLPIAR